MDAMSEIRKRAKTEEIDYLLVMDCLSSYKQPRDKLTKLLKAKKLIRVKKGLYVFGNEYQKRPYSLEVLANLIYGPSYVSFEYALSFYNLIPERVEKVTSASFKKNKYFSTPVGEFVYTFVHPDKFSCGTTMKSFDEYTHFRIATKEKALADFVAKLKLFKNKEDFLQYIIEGVRIDEKDLFNMDFSLLRQIATIYKNKNVDYLCQITK